jgi:hypothetical protein
MTGILGLVQSSSTSWNEDVAQTRQFFILFSTFQPVVHGSDFSVERDIRVGPEIACQVVICGGYANQNAN